MRDGHTHRVCPSCGAVATAERVTCDLLRQSHSLKGQSEHRVRRAAERRGGSR